MVYLAVVAFCISWWLKGLLDICISSCRCLFNLLTVFYWVTVIADFSCSSVESRHESLARCMYGECFFPVGSSSTRFLNDVFDDQKFKIFMKPNLAVLKNGLCLCPTQEIFTYPHRKDSLLRFLVEVLCSGLYTYVYDPSQMYFCVWSERESGFLLSWMDIWLFQTIF